MNNALLDTKELLFDKCNFTISNIEIEKEGANYCAHQFKIDNKNILFRAAKITPKKIGQFVTLWKRKDKKSIIEPFEISDNIDLFVINVKTETNFGQFIFPKSVLVKQGIVSDKTEGKRGIRVYPIWDLVESKQAKNTQKWQLKFFLKIPFDDTLDINRTKSLYFIK